LRQLKLDILAMKKMREAEDAAKAKGSGERPIGPSIGHQLGSTVGETTVSQKASRAAAGNLKANEFDSGGSM
jgi:hypothetical protein